MRNYAKVGGKKGKPAYRTPSSFRLKKIKKTKLRRNLTNGPNAFR